MTMFSKLSRALWVLAAMALVRPALADEVHYGKADLDQMLAPIALYPDSVLSHVLIAATYPLDVAQAARWSRAHPDLQGEDAVDAVEGRAWDPSVKALVAFPEILARMDDDLDWTERLGEAFLDDQGEVMDRVQFLRARAYDEGHLDSMDQVHVIREREVIYIEPAVTEVLYVPYYDPWFVYGSWWWPDYPPYCWHRWGGRPVSYYGPGFYWGVGFRVAPTFYFSSFQWQQRQVVVVHDHRRPMYSGRDAAHFDDVQAWRHEPDRVRGMHYRRDRGFRPPDHEAGPRGDTRRDAPIERHERRREPLDERVEHNNWRQEERRELRREPPEPRHVQPGERASRREERGFREAPANRAPSREPVEDRAETQGRGPAVREDRGGENRGRDTHGTQDNGQGRGRPQRQQNR